MNKAIDEIKRFDADYGGTDMGPALEKVVSEIKLQKDMTMKVFLLTDGEDNSPDFVIEIAKNATQSYPVNIHTFGIGTDVNNDFIIDVAKNGKGTFNLVPDT